MVAKRQPRRRPSTTVDGREAQLVSAAIDLAEKQIQEGTASSQVITHFLKLGSSREQLEQQRLVRENALLDAKVEQLASQQRMDELYREALDAMSMYSGRDTSDDAGYDEFDD